MSASSLASHPAEVGAERDRLRNLVVHKLAETLARTVPRLVGCATASGASSTGVVTP